MVVQRAVYIWRGDVMGWKDLQDTDEEDKRMLAAAPPGCSTLSQFGF